MEYALTQTLPKNMDIQKLRREHPKLLKYLIEKRYSAGYIRRIEKMLKLLFDNESNYNNYEEFFERFVFSEGLQSSDKLHKPARIALRAIYAFEELGRYPDKVVHDIPLGRACKYSKLLPQFQTVIDNYQVNATKTSKCPNTIHSEAANCSAFLFSMQENGATTLSGISNALIRAFFFDRERMVRGLSYKSNIEAVLKGNTGFDTWEECKRIADALPPIRKSRKNYPYLKEEEIHHLWKELEHSDKMSLRDKAILKLLYFTGLRGVDISKLKLSDINWRADRISLVQSKTGTPLSLPLRATVGNAIFDYIKVERLNETGKDNLFINKHNPEKLLSIRSVGQIVTRNLVKAGIRHEEGQKGVRLFRHNLASRLLESDVPTRVISDILGHLSPLSLNPYIDADIKHLRECGLSIEDFPVRKEVFEVWKP